MPMMRFWFLISFVYGIVLVLNLKFNLSCFFMFLEGDVNGKFFLKFLAYVSQPFYK